MAVAQVLGRHAPECRGEHLRFAVSPKLVMADEPTMAPDLRSAAEHFALHKLYEELTTSVIVAMHHMGVIAEATDRVSFCVPGVQSRPDPPSGCCTSRATLYAGIMASRCSKCCEPEQ